MSVDLRSTMTTVASTCDLSRRWQRRSVACAPLRRAAAFCAIACLVLQQRTYTDAFPAMRSSIVPAVWSSQSALRPPTVCIRSMCQIARPPLRRSPTLGAHRFRAVGVDVGNAGPSFLPCLRSELMRFVHRLRRSVGSLTLAFLLVVACVRSTAVAAHTGGRMGGSFKPSTSRSCNSNNNNNNNVQSSGGYNGRKESHSWGGACRTGWGYDSFRYTGPSTSPVVQYRSDTPTPAPAPALARTPYTIHSHTVARTRPSPRMYTTWSTVAVFAILANTVVRNTLGRDTSNPRRRYNPYRFVKNVGPLGSGVSVLRLSLAFDIPDRTQPECILEKLKAWSKKTDTGTRRGVQDLVAGVALDLLRDEHSIYSAGSTYIRVPFATDAERAFNELSVTERAKVEREVMNNYGGVDLGAARDREVVTISEQNAMPLLNATAAVVTLLVSIEGDRTTIPNSVASRGAVRNALTRIATDVQVDECLLAAEVLWTPVDRNDVWTRQDVAADYPDLRFLQ